MKEFGKSFKDTLTFFALFKTAILCCLHFTGALKQDHLWLSIWLNLAFIWSNVLHTHRIYLVFPPPHHWVGFQPKFQQSGGSFKGISQEPYVNTQKSPILGLNCMNTQRFTPHKERENECTGFQVNPFSTGLSSFCVVFISANPNPGMMPNTQAPEGTELSQVLSPADGVRGPWIPSTSTRIQNRGGVAEQPQRTGQSILS